MRRQCLRPYTKFGNGPTEGLTIFEDPGGQEISDTVWSSFGPVPVAMKGFDKIGFWFQVRSSGGGSDALNYGTERVRWDAKVGKIFWGNKTNEGSLAYADYTGPEMAHLLAVSNCWEPMLVLSLQKAGVTSTWKVYKVLVVRFRIEDDPTIFGSVGAYLLDS